MRLPFPIALWTFPLSPEVAASQHLLWGFWVLVVVPLLGNIRCCGGKRVVQANQPVGAVWALAASCCPAAHKYCPDVQLLSWAHVALPHN